MSTKKEINLNKVVVFTGAGISVESGLKTYNEETGHWHDTPVSKVATKAALNRNPEVVIDFWNKRKKEMVEAKPNAAHIAIAELEKYFDVTVITTNVDNLHEKAGSTNVIHIHGDVSYARSQVDLTEQVYIGDNLLSPSMRCLNGERLRPDVVMYDEFPYHLDEASDAMRTAARVLVVGSSLSVKPACNIPKKARGRADKIIVAHNVLKKPFGYRLIRENASTAVPRIVERWLKLSGKLD